MYDLLIIGGGPAGVAAGVYAARKRIKTVLIAEDFGGQSIVSEDVQNFIGIVSLPGSEIASRFKEHLEAYSDDVLDIQEGDRIISLNKINGGYEARSKGDKKYEAHAVLMASGAHRRKLTIEGAERLDNKGISYCASCDAPLFRDKDVVVIGGGNAGFESASQLLEYATSVTLFERGGSFLADLVTVEKVLKNKKMKALTNVELKEIKGDKFVESVIYTYENGEHELKVGGVFVEIGSVPNSDFVKDLVELNKRGEIVVDHKTQRSSRDGIWAAGDVSDVLYKQNNISMGDGVKALEDIYLWLQKNHK